MTTSNRSPVFARLRIARFASFARRLAGVLLASSATLGSAACDDGAKDQAAVAAAATAASAAKAAADAKLEEAAAAARKAKAEASRAFEEKRGQARRSLESEANAMERRYSSLAEKAAKLQGPAKAKAEKAKDSLEKARAQIGADLKDFGNLTDTTFAAASAKAAASVAAFERALDEFEMAVTGKVTKRDGGK